MKNFCENVRCGQFRILHRDKKSGKYICVPCKNSETSKGFCENERCCKLRRLHKNKKSRKYLCASCSNPRKICSGCGRVRPVAMSYPNILCSACYQKSPWNRETCSKCKKSKAVFTHDEFGNPICRSRVCRRKAGKPVTKRVYANVKVCSKCQKPKLVYTRDAFGPICRSKVCRRKKGMPPENLPPTEIKETLGYTITSPG